MKNFNDKKVLRYLSLAKKASEFSDDENRHLGAIAVYKGIILAVGYNHRKTSPVQKKYNKYRNLDISSNKCTFHAESHCLNKIKKLDIDFSKVSVFVYREHKNGTMALARPCEGCRKLIEDLGIKSFYYTTEKGWAYETVN